MDLMRQDIGWKRTLLLLLRKSPWDLYYRETEGGCNIFFLWGDDILYIS